MFIFSKCSKIFQIFFKIFKFPFFLISKFQKVFWNPRCYQHLWCLYLLNTGTWVWTKNPKKIQVWAEPVASHLRLKPRWLWYLLKKEHHRSYCIWVRFPRTGILAKMWSVFEKSRAFVRLNLIIFIWFCNCSCPRVSLAP